MKPKTRFIVTILFGWAGIHRFADRKIGTGILYLCTFGLFGIGWIVDSVKAYRMIAATAPSLSGPAPVAQDTVFPDAQNAEFRKETFEVVGTYYYRENIGKLATRNPDWRKQGKALVNLGYANKHVYRYNYIHKPVRLIQEDENPHDHNAVMVQVAGEKVGYISADEAVHVRDILNRRSVKYISAFVGGGDYKIINEDGTFERFEDDPYIRVSIGYK